jgi:hypothetical protein
MIAPPGLSGQQLAALLYLLRYVFLAMLVFIIVCLLSAARRTP